MVGDAEDSFVTCFFLGCTTFTTAGSPLDGFLEVRNTMGTEDASEEAGAILLLDDFLLSFLFFCWEKESVTVSLVIFIFGCLCG